MDTLTSLQRSERMSRVRGHGNKSTELRLIRLFREAKISGWRRRALLPGKPDFVFPRRKVALFVDGCFWHGCPLHKRVPKSKIAFWSAKLAANIKRDRTVARILRKAGWQVLRIWECKLTPRKQASVIVHLQNMVGANAIKRGRRRTKMARSSNPPAPRRRNTSSPASDRSGPARPRDLSRQP